MSLVLTAAPSRRPGCCPGTRPDSSWRRTSVLHATCATCVHPAGSAATTVPSGKAWPDAVARAGGAAACLLGGCCLLLRGRRLLLCSRGLLLRRRRLLLRGGRLRSGLRGRGRAGYGHRPARRATRDAGDTDRRERCADDGMCFGQESQPKRRLGRASARKASRDRWAHAVIFSQWIIGRSCVADREEFDLRRPGGGVKSNRLALTSGRDRPVAHRDLELRRADDVEGRDDVLARQGPRSVLDPDLPVDAIATEREMVAAHAVDDRLADDEAELVSAINRV